MTGKLPSMSDDEFKNKVLFVVEVAKRFNLNVTQAEALIFTSWRKFKLILAKDRELRQKLKGFL